MGLKINTRHKEPIEAANSTRLRCHGSTTFHIEYQGTSTKINALVTSSMSDSLLISWHDLQNLEVLPRNFPARSQCWQTHITDQINPPRTLLPQPWTILHNSTKYLKSRHPIALLYHVSLQSRLKSTRPWKWHGLPHDGQTHLYGRHAPKP